MVSKYFIRLFLIIHSINFYRLIDLMNIAEFVQVVPDCSICHLANRTLRSKFKNGAGIMKRSRHMIISEILNICSNGASKTKIVYQANLNFRTVNPYIDLLMKNDLITVKQGSTLIYETTDRGLVLLENFKQINNELTGI